MTDSLKQINQECAADPAFRSLAMRSRFIPGTGTAGPLLVLVGEAPGEQDNEAGTPFAGPLGDVVDVLLDRLDLAPGNKPRDACYMTTLVKYRTPEGRTPTDDEVKAALPYLRRELQIVARKMSTGQRPIVCLFGKTASLLFGKGHGLPRGEVVDRKGWRYAYLYHPSVALHDPKMLAEMRTQFSNVVRNI